MTRPRLLTGLLPAGTTAVAAGWLLSSNAWSWWGVRAMELKTTASTSFADLANVTLTANCMRAGIDFTVCDPYGRPFQPYVVLPARVLAALGGGSAQTGALGIALVVIYLLTILALGVVLARHWRHGIGGLFAAQAVLAIATITPPAMLAIERGQIELLTLALAVVSWLLFAGTSRVLHWAGAVVGVLSTLTKFFSIGLFLPALRRQPRWAGIVGLGASLLLLALNIGNVMRAGAASDSQLAATSRSQFGVATIVPTVLTSEPVGYIPDDWLVDSWTMLRLIGVLVFIVAALVAAWLLPGHLIDALRHSPTIWWLVVGSTGVLVVPYLLGVSYDYRLLFALPLLVGILICPARSAWFTTVVTVLILFFLLTSAAMVPTPNGLIWGRWWITAGDLALFVVLAGGTGAWLRALRTQVS